MRHQVFGRLRSRDANERKSLLKSLTSEIISHGYIKTTESKAKAIKGLVDKLVKKNGATRIIRLGQRKGDRALMVRMELVVKETGGEKAREQEGKKVEIGDRKMETKIDKIDKKEPKSTKRIVKPKAK